MVIVLVAVIVVIKGVIRVTILSVTVSGQCRHCNSGSLIIVVTEQVFAAIVILTRAIVRKL